MNRREYCKTCGNCGRRDVVIAVVPYTAEFDDDGEKIMVTVSDLSVPRCANCGTLSIDHDAANQITDAFRQKTGLLRPEELRHLRNIRRISQEVLAQLLGVSLSDIIRWEAGDQMQSRQADKALRALFQQPASPANEIAANVAPLASPDLKVG